MLGRSHEALVDIIVDELIDAAIDAGHGSDMAETAAEILVTIASTTVRGMVIARLRKVSDMYCSIEVADTAQTIAQTYNKPSRSLCTNQAWPEISALTRLTLALSFDPPSPLDIQLFLPELCHIITLLLASGPLTIRQTMYALTVNIVTALAGGPFGEDMDGAALQQLLERLTGTDSMISHFGMARVTGGFAILGKEDEVEINMLGGVEEVAKFFGELIVAAALSIGKLRRKPGADYRLRECLASSMDRFGRWHVLPT
jgi:neurofibromin 1